MTDVEITQTIEPVKSPAFARLIAFLRESINSRWEIARELPKSGTGVTAAAIVLNTALGILPVLFILGTSFMLGRVPAAAKAGVHSGAWNSLVLAFLLAAAAFVVLQVLTPLQASLGELITRRVDGQTADRLISDSLRTVRGSGRSRTRSCSTTSATRQHSSSSASVPPAAPARVSWR